MLRITIQADANLLTFRLEGRLAGPWVAELRESWEVAGRPAVVEIDLRSVIYADAAGKELLGEMHRQGAKLVANDCQMKAIIAEIEAAATANQ